MSDLSLLLQDEKRAFLVTDLSSLVDNAVASQSGITGVAVKGALSAARRINADIVPKAVSRLLPDILGDLQHHWTAYEESGQADFGTFLEPRSQEVADSLLGSADRAVAKAGIGAVEKIYRPMRGRGSKILTPQVPELGRVLERHMRG